MDVRWLVVMTFYDRLFCSSRRRHTSGALVTGVQTGALPISRSSAVAPDHVCRGGHQLAREHAAGREEDLRVLQSHHRLEVAAPAGPLLAQESLRNIHR